MLGRLFKRNPYTHKRAEALTVDFLKKHKERVSGEVFARRLIANIEAGGEDGALVGFGPHAQAQIGYYPNYAVHLARYALVYCTSLMAEPPDPDNGLVHTGMAVWQGLGTDPETAGEMVMQTLENMPRKEDGSEFRGDEVAVLLEDERRLVLIEEFARKDAQIVLEAFGRGDKTVDLLDHDVEPLAELLDLTFVPDPDHERLAARLKPVQD